MAKLGTYKRPVIVRVQSIERAEEIAALCQDYGWHFISGVEPDKPEGISDVEELLRHVHKAENKITGPQQPPRVSPNDYCPCGSGKKFKNCCGIS